MAGRLDFSFNFKGREAGKGRQRDEEEPMRILVLADLSGREARGVHEGGAIGTRAVQKVDIDNFDTVLSRIGPTLPWSGTAEPLAFRTIEDFHPDELYRTLPIFARLRGLRMKLLDSSTAAEAMAEIGSALATGPQPDAAEADEGDDGDEGVKSTEDDSSTIERLLGSKPSGGAASAASPGAAPASGAEAANALIAKIVGPHIVPDAPPHRDAYLDAVNNALSDHMRGALHHPAFQEIEATWRSVHLLVSELGGEDTLEIHLLDVSRRELAEDLEAAKGELEQTQAYALLVKEAERKIGPSPWSLIVGSYRFEAEEEQMRLLAALGALASHCGGPFIAEGDSRMVGSDSLVSNPDSTTWAVTEDVAEFYSALRSSPAASWIGLALPRVMLRQPYGASSDELDSFEFEEMSAVPEHEAYLWGNAAFGVALLLGRSFSDRGWEMQPGDVLDLSELPSHIYSEDGEKKMKPCAEVVLSDRAVDAMIKAGVMPMVSFRDRNAVRAPRLQSVAQPAAALSGPWGK